MTVLHTYPSHLLLSVLIVLAMLVWWLTGEASPFPGTVGAGFSTAGGF